MTTPDDASRARDRGDDALRKLVERGGAVWAFKRGQGSILELSYAREREGAAIVTGRVWPEVWVHHFDPDREESLLPSGEEMLALGWAHDEKLGGLARSWAVRTRLDRSNVRRDVDRAVALLAEARGEEPASYRLTYRPPGETDAGYGQMGCVLALASTFVGDTIGAIGALLAGQRLDLVASLAIFAAVIALIVGGLATGTVVPRVAARVPALRARGESIGLYAMVVVSGIVALLTWPVVITIGVRDPATLIGASVLAFVAANVLPLLAMFAVLARKP